MCVRLREREDYVTESDFFSLSILRFFIKEPYCHFKSQAVFGILFKRDPHVLAKCLLKLQSEINISECHGKFLYIGYFKNSIKIFQQILYFYTKIINFTENCPGECFG